MCVISEIFNFEVWSISPYGNSVPYHKEIAETLNLIFQKNTDRNSFKFLRIYLYPLIEAKKKKLMYLRTMLVLGLVLGLALLLGNVRSVFISCWLIVYLILNILLKKNFTLLEN